MFTFTTFRVFYLGEECGGYSVLVVQVVFNATLFSGFLGILKGAKKEEGKRRE